MGEIRGCGGKYAISDVIDCRQHATCAYVGPQNGRVTRAENGAMSCGLVPVRRGAATLDATLRLLIGAAAVCRAERNPNLTIAWRQQLQYGIVPPRPLAMAPQEIGTLPVQFVLPRSPAATPPPPPPPPQTAPCFSSNTYFHCSALLATPPLPPRGPPPPFSRSLLQLPHPFNMDYAQYVSRRPPSPPPLRCNYSPPLSASPIPPTHEPDSNNTPSTLLHRRAIRDEYSTLSSQVRSAATIQSQRDRHEAVRIRLEDLLTRADPRAQKVLHLALDKCNANLAALVDRIRTLDDTQARMRVIESKHFLGHHPHPHTSTMRSLHVRREAIATLVDQIACTLHDQVRIHHLLTVLASRIALLRANLASLDRADRPHPPPHLDRSTVVHATAVTDTHTSNIRHPFSRRNSRSALRRPEPLTPSSAPDRPTARSSVLRSQRSLPRRSDNRLIPSVVKRALSYNASQGRDSMDEKHDASWWGHTPPDIGRSQPQLSLPETSRGAWRFGETSLRDMGRMRDAATRLSFGHEEEIADDESFPPVSPVSQCTASDGSPRTNSKGGRGSHGSRADSAFDRSVLVDIDSLCTEASSVLSLRKGVDIKPVRRGSVPPALFAQTGPLSRFRLGRLRGSGIVKKMWGEINELYGVILTHGPHLVEEKIVTRASLSQGILGPWSAHKGGKPGSLRGELQVAAAGEAARKVDSVILWQQRLVVAIRRDFLEHRKSLRQADAVVSQEFVRSLEQTRR